MPATKNLFKVSIVRYHLIYCSHVIADFEQFFVDWWLTVGKNLLKVSIITAEPRSSDCCSYIIMLTLSRFLLTVFYCSIVLLDCSLSNNILALKCLKNLTGVYLCLCLKIPSRWLFSIFRTLYQIAILYVVSFSWYH